MCHCLEVMRPKLEKPEASFRNLRTFLCLWGWVAGLSLCLSCLILDRAFAKQHTAKEGQNEQRGGGEGKEEGKSLLH